MKKAKFLLFAALACVGALAFAGGGNFAGDAACADCHEVGASFQKSFHSTYFKQGDEFRCEACHGSGQQHVEEGDPAMIAGPGNAMKLDKNCLACHNTAFHGLKEQHVVEFGVGCGDCHTIHQPAYKGSLEKDDLCLDCHMEIKAKMNLPSHHPVREGKMACTDCHAFDGSEAMLAERINEDCLECHAHYKGPFVFEHDPVAEDCGICHDPHGSVANNLLKANEPFICLQCHQMHFHTAVPGYEGSFTPPNHTERGPYTSTLTGGKSGFLTKCTQCHTQVHGSDLPSEAISAYGRALTR